MTIKKRCLIVKTSSMGDVIQTLPAVTDAIKQHPEYRFDWLVEENFVDIPRWHRGIDQVIAVPFRRLRSRGLLLPFHPEWREFKKQLKQHRYDVIIDAQGLLKSAFLSRKAHGPTGGFDWQSAREPMASLLYDTSANVSKQQHAIDRNRQLLAKLLDYSMDGKLDYGISLPESLVVPQRNTPYVLCFVNTTWQTKRWPTAYWRRLLLTLTATGIDVIIPAGTGLEPNYVNTIATGINRVTVIANTSIRSVASLIANSQCVVSVDTGFAHLSAALNHPTVVIYGATDPEKIGTRGQHQFHLRATFRCSPCHAQRCRFKGLSEVYPACYQTINNQHVWQTIKPLLSTVLDENL